MKKGLQSKAVVIPGPQNAIKPLKTPRKKYTLVDLPAGTLDVWRTTYIPMWLDHLGTLQNPWDCARMLEKAQVLWDQVYPRYPQVLVAKDEAIFNLVRTDRALATHAYINDSALIY